MGFYHKISPLERCGMDFVISIFDIDIVVLFQFDLKAWFSRSNIGPLVRLPAML